MAIDTNLIKGAYEASAPSVSRSGSADGLVNLGDNILKSEKSNREQREKKVKEVSDKIQENTNKASEEFENHISKFMNEGEITDILHDKLYDGISMDKPAYAKAVVDGDKKEISRIQNKVNRISNQVEVINDLQNSLANYEDGKEVSTFFTNTPLGKSIYSALSDKDGSISMGKDGLQIKVGDEDMSVEDFEALVDKVGYVDEGFKTFVNDKLNSMQLENSQYASGLQEGTKNGLESLIRQQVNSSNRNSLVFDNIVGNTSLFQDLFDSLKDKKYSDLNITDEMLKDADINPGDSIDVDDVLRMVEEITSSREGKEIIIKYYKDALLNNFKPAATVGDNKEVVTVKTKAETKDFTMYDPSKD